MCRSLLLSLLFMCSLSGCAIYPWPVANARIERKDMWVNRNHSGQPYKSQFEEFRQLNKHGCGCRGITFEPKSTLVPAQ
jgi:hypothetical protein